MPGDDLGLPEFPALNAIATEAQLVLVPISHCGVIALVEL